MTSYFFFAQSIDDAVWKVCKPIVKLGKHGQEFFFYVDSADADRRVFIEPPNDLYESEFLKLDHRDVFQLMEFQQKWGPIAGLRLRPNPEFLPNALPNVASDRGFFGSPKNEFYCSDGLSRTENMYLRRGEGTIVLQRMHGAPDMSLGRIVSETARQSRYQHPLVGVVPNHVASVQEVAEAVCHGKTAIRAITSVRREDCVSTDWKKYEGLVKESIRYCNRSLASITSAIELFDGDRPVRYCTLMQHLFICLVRGVKLNGAYRICQNPRCGKLFTPGEYARRSDSKYCSGECQQQAKYARAVNIGSKTNKRLSRDAVSGNELSKLVLSWNTAGGPEVSVTRDELVKAKDGLCGITRSMEAEDIVRQIEFSDFEIYPPSTEPLLNELIQRWGE